MLLSNTMTTHTPDHSKATNPSPPFLQTQPFTPSSSIHQQSNPTISNPHINHPHPHLSPSPYLHIFPSPYQSPFQAPLSSPPINKSLTRPSLFPVSSHPSTATQSKWRVSPEQKRILSAAFDQNPYPELTRKQALAAELGVTTPQVSKWFQHRRESLTRSGQFKAQYNRTRRTPEELEALERAFTINHYLSSEHLAELASTVQLSKVTPKQIKLWFKHRRKQYSKRARTNVIPSAPADTPPHRPRMLSPPHPTNDIFPPPSAADNQAPPSVSQDCPRVSSALPALQHSHSQLNMAVTNLGTLAPSAAPTTYPILPTYDYKSQPVNVPPFLEAELMALRGALAVSNGAPPPDALGRLASMLSRPVTLVAGWFRSQVEKTLDPGPDLRSIGGNFVQQEGRPISSDGAFQGDHTLGYNPRSTYVGSMAAHSDGAGSQILPLGGLTATYESDGKFLGAAEGKGEVENIPVTASSYHGYTHPSGVAQPAVHFSQGQNSWAPMLAPLRYVPTSNVPYPTSHAL